MKAKLIKKLDYLLLMLMLTNITGCKVNTTSPKSEITSVIDESQTPEIMSLSKNSVDEKEGTLITNIYEGNKIFTNNYEEYKDYFANTKPTYALINLAIDSNDNIPDNYKEALHTVVDLFQKENIKESDLVIFYENLRKLTINTDYHVGSSRVLAFFQSDPYAPSITVDDLECDYATFVHEVIHSCHEVELVIDDKIVHISNKGIEIKKFDNLTVPIVYGTGYTEAQAEYVSQMLTKNKKIITETSFGYTNSTSILEFVFKSLDISTADAFAYSVKDFENILRSLNISEHNIKYITNHLDKTIKNKGSLDPTLDFYKIYLPKLIDYYLESNYTSEEIYKKIGNILKDNVIERIEDRSSTSYRLYYLNNQKRLFDYIDLMINISMDEKNMEKSSIYPYIGHEFEILYNMYGEETNLNSGKYYLAHNWDEVATQNSNLHLYVDNGIIKMCLRTENPDGTTSFYNSANNNLDVRNGTYLNNLVLLELISIEDGYIIFNVNKELLIQTLSHIEVTPTFKKEASLNSQVSVFQVEDDVELYNTTENESGEEIAFQIYGNQMILIPDHSKKLATMQELYDNGIIGFDENNQFTIETEALIEYLNKKQEQNNKKILK